MIDFWSRLDGLLAVNDLIIDRPKNSRHPRYPDIVYPLDYGFLKGTAAGDGSEIDLWRGSMLENKLVGVVCTVDTLKADSEVKLLIGCTDKEINIVNDFCNNEYMSSMVIKRYEDQE